MSVDLVRPLRPRLSAQLCARFDAQFVAEHLLGPARFERWFGERRRRLRKSMLRAAQGAGPGRTHAVPAVSDISPAEFEARYAVPGMPVVFKQRALHWRACRQWSFDFFSERFGLDQAIVVNHPIYGESDGAPPFEVTTLEELLDELAAGGQRYARFHPLLDRHPELRRDLDEAWLSSMTVRPTGDGLPFRVLFLGPASTSTPIHSAGNDNLFIQIRGRKRWHLWLPDSRYAFEPEANRGPAKSCGLDPLAPDLKRWPLYRFVDTMETVLEPGDVLYVPSYTWHHVENLDPTIGVGCRWTSLRQNAVRDPLLTSMEFLNTNPSLLTTMLGRGEFDFNRILVRSMGLRVPA